MEKIIIQRPVEDIEWESSGNLHPLLKRIYLARGIKSPEQIEHNIENLISYEKLSGIETAVSCLYSALLEQEHILIIGDFDADGATSTALTIKALRSFGMQKVSYLVPNRFEYGYGLTPKIVEEANRQNPDLIITVDNGIASIDGVNTAKKMGIKVIITDHHISGECLPHADALVNPNQKGDQFPHKNLAGVGVIFYVMLAFRKLLREENWFIEKEIPEPNMAEFLDLVALGTIADVVALDQNNRILVYQGVRRIRADRCCPGIKALLNVAGKNSNRAIAGDLGYVVAPRINAAGRLDDMLLGIECLLSDDYNKAYDMAVQLNTLNSERKAIESDMQKQAFTELNRLELDKNPPAGLCLFDENWHQGVIGILAGRIKDRLHRPVIAFAKINSTEIKGSARSIPGLHIRDIIENIANQNSDLINKFGGHAMAAGLNLPLNKYKEFCRAFETEVSKYLLEDNLYGQIYTDGELTSEEMTLETSELLRDANPWGQDFPEPSFEGEFNIIQQKLVGNKHLKLELNIPGDAKNISAIAFNVDLKQWPNYQCNRIFAVYRLDINEYRGICSLQLIIEYLEPILSS